MAVGGDKLRGYEVHAEVGLLILVLAGLRLVWRLIVPPPINDADTLGWQTKVADVTHVLFYICFFLLPISGWMMWSALDAARPLSLAGVLPWPQMPFEGLSHALQWWILDHAETIHHLLVILLALLVPAHVGAALKHHFWDHHDVLEGMLPEIPGDDEPEKPRHGLPPPAPRQA
jgi:cytochrome b561